MTWRRLIERTIAVRRELHTIPEPCWQELATSTLIGKRLDSLGISWRQCAKTGVVAQVGTGKEGLHLALRADMDGVVLDEAVDIPWKSTITGCMHGLVMMAIWQPCLPRWNG